MESLESRAEVENTYNLKENSDLVAFYLFFKIPNAMAKFPQVTEIKPLKSHRSECEHELFVTNKAGSHEMNICATAKPSTLKYLLFVKYEHCFIKVWRCFHSGCNL